MAEKLSALVPQGEDAVGTWLRRLAEREEGARPVTGPIETPAAPTVTGPVSLTPLPSDDDADVDPSAEPYFAEALRQVRRAVEPKAEKQRDLFRVLSRNIDCYLRFTRRRLAYLYQGMRPKDRATFSVVPWLLQSNVPGTPGYQQGTHPAPPHGVKDFDFNPTMQAAVQEVFPRALQQRASIPHRPVIKSILVMGSVGTIGHSGGSDIDYWIVYDEGGLNATERTLLSRKVDAIALWARERGLEAHFFLVDTERARREDFGKASVNAESSGTAMGRLLKEEFYRTAIYLAGDLPLWWTVPIGLDDDEYQRLAQLVMTPGPPLIPGISLVDLGHVGPIDRGEFFGAALWQINKSLQSPFKSLLKMALLARYLNDDHPALLCDVLKRRVFEGERAPQFTDPYVLLFDAITEYYASRGEWTSFRLIQKCFYLKVGLKLSRERKERDSFLARFRVMRAYILRWGWDRDLLADLDSLDNWSIERVAALGQSIRNFMLNTYRQLVQKVRTSAVRIDEEDVAILGRRLYACFADEPGKIDHLFTYFLKEPRVEERLVVLEVPSAPPHRRWEAHRRLIRGQLTGREKAMYIGADLGEIAAWVVFNGVFAQSTVVALIAQQSRASVAELRHLLERFTGLFDVPDPFAIAPTTFLAPRRITRLGLVVNFDLAKEPEDASGQAGVFYLPENWDILNYGRGRTNQLTQVTVVSLDAWGEMFAQRFAGPDALTAAVRMIFRRLDPDGPPDVPPEIFAPHGRQYQALRNRLGKLVESLYHACVGPLADGRARCFVYEVGGQFQVARRDGAHRSVVRAQSLKGVMRLLGRMGLPMQETTIDALSPAMSDLRALIERGNSEREAEIVVGWRNDRDGGRLYVRDERGRIFAHGAPQAVFDRELVKVFRRIVYHLRARVKSAAELRKLVRVYEFREGRALGTPTTLVEDTARVIAGLATPRPRKVDLWLKGDLREGRQGVYLKLGNEVFSPRQFGRSFMYELVRRVLSEHSVYDNDILAIDASDVVFAPEFSVEGVDRGVCRQLRLIAMYERWLQRALAVFQGGRSRIWTRRSPYRRAERPGGD
jgi:adenylate cyclase class 1